MFRRFGGKKNTNDFVDEYLRYSYPDDRIFNLVISDISVVLRETTLIISDSIETGSPA